MMVMARAVVPQNMARMVGARGEEGADTTPWMSHGRLA